MTRTVLISNTDTSIVVISGDWNTTLNPIDKRGGQPWKATNYRNSLMNLMEELNLTDIYRQINPTKKYFTYESKPLNLKSRIDFFLISRPLSCCVKNTEIRTSIAPDHKSVFLNIEIKNEFARGPGLWKFNNTLLEDENYKELVEFYYPQILAKYREITDKQLLWELIKMELRAKTIKYSKEKRCKLRNEEKALQEELQELEGKICNNDAFDQETLEKYEAAKDKLKRIHDTRGKEAIFRSKTKWFEQGEKPTKYFFNLEKNNYEKKLIREVKSENDEVISNFVQVNKEIENFYNKMYTSKITSNNTSDVSEHNNNIHKFIECLNIPQLNVEEQESLEKDLTFEELKDALTSFADNKSPGEDGFTKEFYEAFFDLLWKDLLNSYNDAFNKGSLSVSQKRGTTTLIPKGDENLSDLKNWRPISLLNIDCKLLSKVLAKRMEQHLPKLIHSDQTGFVNGTYIGRRLLSDIMEFSDSKNFQGILLFVDFEKAFDTLEWSFISKTLEVFNFGNKFKKWFTVLYNGVQSSVVNGGFMTNYFEITREVRQGCPLSPSLLTGRRHGDRRFIKWTRFFVQASWLNIRTKCCKACGTGTQERYCLI